MTVIKSEVRQGAYYDSVVLMQVQKALAELPSLDELRAGILGLLQAPATKLLRTVNEPGSALARLLKARVDKEEQAA